MDLSQGLCHSSQNQLWSLQFDNVVFGQRIVNLSILKQESVIVQDLFNQFHGLDTLFLAIGYQPNCCMEMFLCYTVLDMVVSCFQ